jgi:hypothetical protein
LKGGNILAGVRKSLTLNELSCLAVVLLNRVITSTGKKASPIGPGLLKVQTSLRGEKIMNLQQGDQIISRNRVMGKILEIRKHTILVITHKKELWEVLKTDVMAALAPYDRSISWDCHPGEL